MIVFDKLKKIVKEKGAGFIVLIDPDRKNDKKLETLVENANCSGVDAILVGGSLMMDGRSHDRVARIKDIANIPVIFFPGGGGPHVQRLGWPTRAPPGTGHLAG